MHAPSPLRKRNTSERPWHSNASCLPELNRNRAGCRAADDNPPAEMPMPAQLLAAKPVRLFRRNRGLLGDNQPLDDASHVHSVGVRGDVYEPLIAELVEALLLRFDHFLILKKCRRDLAIELLRRLGIVLPVAIRC